MEQRITWERRTGTGRSGWSGRVGDNKRALFTIEMSVSRRSMWVLRTTLPFQVSGNRDLNADADELKALAERILWTFVQSLGADFE